MDSASHLAKKKKDKSIIKDTIMIQDSDEDQYNDQNIQQTTLKIKQVKDDTILFSPDSQGKQTWDLTCMLCIMYQAILVPYRLCFDDDAHGNMLVFETIIDCIFMSDIFVQFNTGYYSIGKLVKSRKMITLNYLKTWFVIDFISSIPYNYVFTDQIMLQITLQMSGNSTSSTTLSKAPKLLRLIKLARFLRFLRLLRVLKLKQILYRIEELIMNDTIVALFNFLKIILVFLIIAHWLACIYFSIGQSEYLNLNTCWFTPLNVD